MVKKIMKKCNNFIYYLKIIIKWYLNRQMDKINLMLMIFLHWIKNRVEIYMWVKNKKKSIN